MDEGSNQTLTGKGLPDLSTELLLQILSELASTSCYSLSLTNQRLHQLVNPTLYESVYFWGIGNEDTTERSFEYGHGCDELYERQKAPTRASRVFDLDKLGQTLKYSPQVALHMRKIDLTWGIHVDSNGEAWETNEEIEEEKKILRFLDITRSMQLESLVLGPQSLYFQVPTHAAVTTLRTRHEGHYGGDDEDVYPDLDQLHKQCCVPSLEEVTVNGWIYWDNPVGDRTVFPPLVRAKTSPITRLRISSLGAPADTFEDLLSWPQKLRVFHFKCEPYINCGSQYQFYSRIDSEDFIRPLQQCHDTLEELSIRCYVGSNDGVPGTSRPIDLSNFLSLRRLCIRHDFLVMKRLMRDGNSPSFHHVLPPSLEILHLEIVDDNFQMRAIDGKVSEDVYCMFDMLERLAMHKTECFPRLRTVIAGGCPDFYYSHQFSNIMNGCDRGAAVRAAFAREDIRFSCWEKDDEEGVFSGWQKR